MRGSSAFRAAIAPGGVLAGPWVKNELWRRAKAVPSLDLRFADNKSLVDAVTGQSLITFTRASSGTYVGSDGLIKTATTNLLLRSQELATGPWFNANVTLTNNTGDTLDPVGGSTATKIASSGTGAIGQGAVISTVSTGSIWLRTLSGTLNMSLIVYLSNSPFTNIGTANITVTTNWQRFSVTTTNPPSAASYNLQLNGIPAGTLYAWGAQLEQSSTVGEYIPTTSTINSAPRFDHNPTTGESLGLLVEEQRTNSIRNNTMVGAVAGTPGTLPTNWASTTPANGIAREIVGTGTENGIAYIDVKFSGTNTLGSSSYMDTTFDSGTITAAQGQAWTESCYVKLIAGVITGAAFTAAPRLILYEIPNISSSIVSLSPATSDALITQRFSFSRTLTDAATTAVSPRLAFNIAPGGTINFTLRIGLPQLEQGAFATSVIPTTTATVTRSADVASITGTNFSSWYRQDEGTVFADMDRNTSISSASTAVSINDNSTGNRLHNFRQDSASALTVISSTGGTIDGALTLTLVNTSTRNKVVSAQALNNLSCVANGATAVSDTSVAMPVVNQMQIGHVTGTSFYNGTIRRLVFWSQRL